MKACLYLQGINRGNEDSGDEAIICKLLIFC